MLIYHPAQDAYHCVFRILAILDRIEFIEIDKIRILDFYLAFPDALTSVRWPNNIRNARTIAKAQDNPYRRPVSRSDVFRGMHHIQNSAIRCLAASNLVDGPELQVGMVRRTDTALDPEMQELVEGFNAANPELTDLVLEHMSSIPLLGRDGLKARTSLMEFRYDLT